MSDLASKESKNQKGTEQFRLERDWWSSCQGLLLKIGPILRSHMLAQGLQEFFTIEQNSDSSDTVGLRRALAPS